MYTEIFRLTKSVWPLLIMHTMEDAVINPLRLLGFVSVEKNQAFLFSLSVGMIPTILLSTHRPSYTEMGKKTGVWEGELTE